MRRPGAFRRSRKASPAASGSTPAKRLPDSRTGSSAAPEQALDVAELELDEGRATVVARARERRRLHLPQERVHLLGVQPAPGPDRAVAAHPRQDRVEAPPQRSALPRVALAPLLL